MKGRKAALYQEAFSSDEEDGGKEGDRSEIWEHTNFLTRYWNHFSSSFSPYQALTLLISSLLPYCSILILIDLNLCNKLLS